MPLSTERPAPVSATTERARATTSAARETSAASSASIVGGSSVAAISVQRPIVVAALARRVLLPAHRAELLAHAVAAPAPLDLVPGGQAGGGAAAAEEEPADDHAAEVAHVAHVPAAVHRDLEQEEGRDQPDGAEGDRGEDQHDGALGPGERVPEQHAVDGSRGAERGVAERRRAGDAEQHPRVGIGRDDEAGADAAEEVVTEEALGAPGHRERRAEHPEREQV